MTSPLPPGWSARLEAQDTAVRALEAEAVAAATAVTAPTLASILASAIGAFTFLEVTHPSGTPGQISVVGARVLGERMRRALIDLYGRIFQALPLESMLSVRRGEALHLGARHGRAWLTTASLARGTPSWPVALEDSPGLREELTELAVSNNNADARVTAHLIDATDLLQQDPPDTMEDITTVMGVADRATRSAETDAEYAVNAGHAIGSAAVAASAETSVLWIAERDACLHCLALSGVTVPAGQTFPNLTFADRPLRWPDPAPTPPRHPHCRCRVIPYDGPPAGSSDQTDPASALQREARRSVARGLSDSDSRAARLRAADRLVASVPDLPRSVVERAARDVRRGRFTPRPR